MDLFRAHRVFCLLLVVLTAGCQGSSAPPTNDARALEREGEKLRKEHYKEMYNKN